MTQLKKPFALFVYGPTGVGKTDFVLNLAQHLPIEIINMDVGQLYTPLSIGTAKPAWREQETPHHLFDYVDEPCHITAMQYRRVVEQKIDAIQTRGVIPVLVGGSGFYLKSLFFPPASQNSSASFAKNETNNDNWYTLLAIDPVRAHAIHPHDTYRIQRALAIWRETGNLPSRCKPHYSPLVAQGMVLYITRERDELYTRINSRVHVMMKQGWLDEADALRGTAWEPFVRKKKFIGYDDLFAHRAAMIRLDNAITNIQKKSRQYAKRQATLWRGFCTQLLHQWGSTDDFSLEEVNLTFAHLELYIKQLLQRIQDGA